MEKHIEIGMLWDIYGKLLTQKQYDIINDYYNNDLSLSEIAENNNITRQAVRDILKKGENKLFEYEEKLLVMKRTLNQEKQIQQILTQLSKIEETASDKKIEKILTSKVSTKISTFFYPAHLVILTIIKAILMA